MGEGHSNVTGHGSRGPTGGIKGGPAGRGSSNSNRGSGWGTSNTPYGKIHHYSPSQFGRSNRGGNKGGNNHSGATSNTPGLAQRPDMQAYMAVGGVPAVITLIDGNWGITLSRLSVVAAFVETQLTRIGSWAMRTSPIGVAVMGMMPSSIAPDPPMGHYFTTPVLPANRVTDMPKEALQTVADVAVNVRISDVTEAGVQQAVLVKNPAVIQRVPVVKAVPTATPNLYTAPVPGVTPIHINVVDNVVPAHQTPPAVAGKPAAIPIENAPVKKVATSAGRHTRDAIIVFPEGTNIDPLYISMIRIISTHEIREEARRAYEMARSEREVAESALVQGQPFNSVAEEMGLKKSLTDKQVTEVAAHILLLEKNLMLLNQEVTQLQQRLTHLLSPENRRTFRHIPEIRRLRAVASTQQGEVNTLNQGIAELRARQAALLVLQQQVNADIERAEQQRVESARLAAEAAAERQRVENARLMREREKAEARQQEAIRQDTYSLPAYSMWSFYPPGFAVAGMGSIELGQEVIQGLGTSLRMALVRLGAITTSSVADPMAVTVAAAFNPRKEGEGSDKPTGWDRPPLASIIRLANYLVADPMIAAVIAAASDSLKEGEGSDKPAGWDRPPLASTIRLANYLVADPMIAAVIAAASDALKEGEGPAQLPDLARPLLAGAIPLHSMWLSHGIWSAKQADIELPIRMVITDADGLMEVHAVKTGVGGVSARVKLVGAQYDAAKGTYFFTTDNLPSRTFMFTPVTPPGTDLSPVLPQPESAPALPLHTGETVIRHAVIHTVFPLPALEEHDFHDYVIWFPADSGLEPVYVYLKSPRDEPGIVTGRGQSVTGIWLAGAGEGLGAPIPAQIADQLRGRRFSSFDKFREAFWVAVGHDPELVGQFNIVNKVEMINYRAPYPPAIEKVDGRKKYEIHHIKFIKNGGEVYNVDNLRVMTPKLHVSIHSKKRGK
ncbi:S-type pyocin domain-containing protein [Yersinia bercovieri]|uniref:S-type pyocin domain-containing protein n=1 Tax=Yersinia bercovieri TaxID=634 RepID=UPI0015D4A8E5|nr:S-type pyocin domain-containing protein [Yersinia bercovieri]